MSMHQTVMRSSGEPFPNGTTGADLVVIVLALMMFLAPAVGVPNEEMLQDTLKSIVVSFGALLAGLLLVWHERRRTEAMEWHGLMWLPLALLLYALGSMVWSHTYLAGVETVRWFIFCLILWVGLNTLSRERLPLLATGIHWGAVLASVWVGLQFWIDFKLFPQGPNPASTFLNRNFFAEFVVSTLPFSVLLAAQARGTDQIALRVLSTAFNLLALMMTGTRSALLALLILLLVLPVILFLYRDRFEFPGWTRTQALLAAGIVLGTVLGLGSLETRNSKLVAEQVGVTALERTFVRARSLGLDIEYTTGSSSVRLIMWKATARLIANRPLSGVGAGAWEVDIPLYQTGGEQLETDYYVHNEILQLLAEYGLVGWLFLLALVSYLVLAARATWRNRSDAGRQEAPWRAMTLASLLAFLLVSNAGFPWRMASTGALFALCLAILAASDLRLGGVVQAGRMRWQPRIAQGWLVGLLACSVLAAWIAWQAAACESRLVRAVKLALTISGSGTPQDPSWNPRKAEMLQLVREGIAINPHYRKITPMVADELVRWGDWENATWIWESVLQSRPHVVALMSNVARGYLRSDELAKASLYLGQAQAIRPDAPSVRSLAVLLRVREGLDAQAAGLIRAAMEQNLADFDLLNQGYLVGVRIKDWTLATDALILRNRQFPTLAVDGWLKIGQIYASPEARDENRARQAFQAALAATPEQHRERVRQAIPPPYRTSR